MTLERSDIREELALLVAACPGQIPPETAKAWAEELWTRAQDLDPEDLAEARGRVACEEGRPTLARLLAHARERATRRRGAQRQLPDRATSLDIGAVFAGAIREQLALPREERPQTDAEWEACMRDAAIRAGVR
jgi:hypothetical protein